MGGYNHYLTIFLFRKWTTWDTVTNGFEHGPFMLILKGREFFTAYPIDMEFCANSPF